MRSIRGIFHRPRHSTGVPVAELHERLHEDLVPVGLDAAMMRRACTCGDEFYVWRGMVRIPRNWEPEAGMFVVPVPPEVENFPALVDAREVTQ